MTRTAVQILEQGRARRGERFDRLQLITPGGEKLRCPDCQAVWFYRRPLDDIGEQKCYGCERDCGFGVFCT